MREPAVGEDIEVREVLRNTVTVKYGQSLAVIPMTTTSILSGLRALDGSPTELEEIERNETEARLRAVRICLQEQMPVGTIDILTKTKTGVLRATTEGMQLMSTAPANGNDGWEMIEITVDSGACDTVLPSKMLPSVPTDSTEASENCEEYEVANGHSIVNEGEKRCVMMTPGSKVPKGIVFQVTDVHKPLMSVGAMADAGFECLMAKQGGFMRDVDTGELIPLQRRGNLYVLQAWVRSADAPFGRPS